MNIIDLNDGPNGEQEESPPPALPSVAPVASVPLEPVDLFASTFDTPSTPAATIPSVPLSLAQPMGKVEAVDSVAPAAPAPIKPSVQFSLPEPGFNSLSSAASVAKPSPAINTASQIEINVSDPHKIGEGMGSYMVYTVTTKTTLPYFRRQSLSVNRRFSDFLGLHEKITEKHSHHGRIVPPPPSKSVVGTAKLKFSKTDEQQLSGSEFLEKRRSALERYLQRNAEHPIICADPDFREFLELETELPRSTSTSTLSGAGMKRMFSFVSDNISKMTFKMDETDTVTIYLFTD